MAFDVLDGRGLTATMVSIPRGDYVAAVPRWERCRDMIAGSDAVKGAATKYLPMLAGQSYRDYDAYKTRALVYGATGRTVAGLSGAISRKPATVAVPEAFAPRLEDVTAQGRDLDQLATEALEEVLSVGRFGVLVDFDGEATLEAARRPYLVPYRTEQVLNWQLVNRQLVMLVLSETVERRPESNPFAVVESTQFRVLQLIDGIATVSVVREQPGSRQLAADPPVMLTRRGQPLPFLPFVCCGPSSLGLEICKPPLLDLVDVNLSHFRTSADLEHGRHFCALPTPWVAGLKPTVGGQAPMTIGPSEAWILEDPQARAGMLEFSGKGLESLVVALDTKETMMSVLGSRLLEGAPQQQETAAAVRLRHSGEDGTLRSVATVISQLFTTALRTMAWWDSATELLDDPAITCDLNQDFLDASLGADQVKVMLLAVQAGSMSFETFYNLLQRAEWTIPGRDFATEKHAILSDDTQLPHDPTPQGGGQ